MCRRDSTVFWKPQKQPQVTLTSPFRARDDRFLTKNILYHREDFTREVKNIAIPDCLFDFIQDISERLVCTYG